MSLTASDVVSLKSALGCWEWAEYISTAIVGLGCVGEFVAEFTKIRDEKWRDKLAKLSTIVVIIGIAGELTATVRTSELSGQIIANVEENAAGANERAAKEERARTAMLLQLQPRDFTKKQMDDFIDAVKGKVTKLNVFTLPDPEAAGYGFEVVQALQSAGVQVEWYPTTAPYFLIPGVSSTGLTFWDDPRVNTWTAISEGFVKAGQSTSMFRDRPAGQDRPGVISPSLVPIPALFVGLKQPAFAAIPEFLGAGSHAIKLPQPHKIPWEQ